MGNYRILLPEYINIVTYFVFPFSVLIVYLSLTCCYYMCFPFHNAIVIIETLVVLYHLSKECCPEVN